LFRSTVPWEIRRHTEYRQNHPAGDGDGEVHAEFYVQVDAEGRAGEGFRIPLSGGHIIKDIWGKDLFEDGEMQQYRFRYEIDPSLIEIRSNTTVSAWEDWEEMLARGTLVAYHGAARADVSAEVRKMVQAKMKNSSEFGAALRWSIQARGHGEMNAVLQGLPRPAGSLRQDGRFTTAYSAGIDLAVIKLAMKINRDSHCKGPVPILFSRDVDKTKTELKDKPTNLTGGKFHNVPVRTNQD
jgi:hypothetical protein